MTYSEGGSQDPSLSFMDFIFCVDETVANHQFDEMGRARRFNVIWGVEENG